MPMMQKDGKPANSSVDAVAERRKELIAGYVRSKQSRPQINASTRTVAFSEDFPCPAYLGKKGKALWDITIDSYREVTFKPAMLPLLENYIVLLLEAQKLRNDIVKNGLFTYIEHSKTGELIMKMRPEGDVFIRLSMRLVSMMNRLNLVRVFDALPPGNPEEILAEKEGEIFGMTSPRSHLLGRETAAMDLKKAA